MRKVLIVWWSFCLFIPLGKHAQVFSHAPIDSPINSLRTYGDTMPAYRPGFGLTTGKSEAESAFQGRFTCGDEELKKYVQSSCKLEQMPELEQAKKLATDMLSNQVQSRMRQELFEYVLIQKKSFKNAAKGVIDPDCILDSDSIEQRFSNYYQMSETDLVSKKKALEDIRQRMGGRKVNDSERRKNEEMAARIESDLLQTMKLRSAKASFTTKIILKAIGYFKHLDHQYSKYCTGPLTEDTELMCLDISGQIERVVRSYPFLFEKDQQSQKNQLLSISQIVYESMAELIARSYLQTNPSSNSTTSLSAQDLQQYGIDFVLNPALNDQKGEPKIEKAIDQAIEHATIGTISFDSSNAVVQIPPTQEMNSNLVKIKAHIATIKSAYNNQLNALDICKMSLDQIIEQFPQVVNQHLLEDKDRDATKAVICAEKLKETYIKDDLDSCIGVSGSLDDVNGVSIDRRNFEFPFSSYAKYNVRRDPQSKNGDFVITLNLNFTKKSDPPSKAEINRKIVLMQEKVSEYFKKQIDSMNPNLQPGVRIAVQLSSGKQQSSINISTCYNFNMPPGEEYDCAKISAAGLSNWENAANITMSSSDKTWYHEITHRFGIMDEYIASYYPGNFIGEHDSLMNSGDKIYPRHIEQMLYPAINCSGVKP